MTSGEIDFTSKDLNKILPSYLINEVGNLKNEKDEEKSFIPEEMKLVSKYIFEIIIFNY